ncbi:MAG: RluA family pseudouridine synthase [Candidatus Omnitrophota bacterium]|jgi:23S rRNA pseudouridine1911/1915/1917 synthase|nr:RluA family pseudouridine synthase [Candidatus Omnitrophota bacterium]MDD5518293.1 RluA family pseudouridine synthase [Candidatus Omnitrophota bacterium]
MQEYALKVSKEQEGMRLDLLVSAFSMENNLGLSRTAIQDLILKNEITVKGLAGVKAHYKVRPQDKIKVIVEDKVKSGLKPEKIPLDIIYEDKDLAIINKPIGLVVHPAPGNYEHTLVNALLGRFKELSDINPQRPGIVHRLDKDTSGVMVIAKNNSSHLKLSHQFAAHSIQRKYTAIVKGRMEFDENVIEAPIARHAIRRESMAVNYSAAARYAKTYYRTLKRVGELSLLQLEPFTGRTHQLRVHLAFIGHPILGDKKYGKNDAFSRLALHAQSLGFIHPATGKLVEFHSSLPQEFLDVMNKNKT